MASWKLLPGKRPGHYVFVSFGSGKDSVRPVEHGREEIAFTVPKPLERQSGAANEWAEQPAHLCPDQPVYDDPDSENAS